MKWCSLYALVLIIFISGCARPLRIKLPPVTEGWRKASAVKSAYVVQKTDTLYSIAWAFNVDYRYLIDINNLKSPYVLHRGQRLYIVSPAKSSIKYRVQTKSQKEFARDTARAAPLSGWLWPTSGKVIVNFNNKLGGNKGVDIAGSQGQPILACNNGVVVYSGTGIRSYGKLIIIKHNDDYLSAYAYNQEMLVVEGQKVKTGQKVATMGKNDESRVALHFEIRRFGKPVNPILYLPPKL